MGMLKSLKRAIRGKNKDVAAGSEYGTSLADFGDYPSFCALAAQDSNVFDTFRTNPAYTRVLEHLPKDLGQEYLDVILRDFDFSKSDFDEFRRNDYYGGARTYYYEGAGQFSPTTLRYIKVLGDLIREFGSLEGKKICEIGVGYGGQARIIASYFDIKSYQLLDLDSVLALDKRYLGHFKDIESKIIYGLDSKDAIECDLVISNYAFSELRGEVQDFYIQKIIKHAKNGYITFNNIAPQGFNHPLESYETLFNKKIKIKDEVPLTHENNGVVIF